MPVRTVTEHGTQDKRSVAFALDWPGWSRGAKTAEDALATLEAYRPRYRQVAELAGMGAEFDAAGPLEVVEDRVGTRGRWRTRICHPHGHDRHDDRHEHH